MCEGRLRMLGAAAGFERGRGALIISELRQGRGVKPTWPRTLS